MNGSAAITAAAKSRSPIPRFLAISAGLVFAASCLITLFFTAAAVTPLMRAGQTARGDFVSFWASGQQLAHHRDPYDATAILNLQRANGYSNDNALIVRNPPSALALVIPLGYLSLHSAMLLWALALAISWMISVRLLAMQFPAGACFNLFGATVPFTFLIALFVPAVICITTGQTGIFALLGFVLFLHLHRDRPLLAGVCLWLCAFKPHLILPFAAVLLLWIFLNRAWRMLAGAALTLFTSTLLILFLDPRAWQQYSHMMHTVDLQSEFIPCLSVALRFAIKPSSGWIQYVPTTLATLWAVTYFLRRRDTWSWTGHGPLLVLISVFASPYSWFTDGVLAVPALFRAAPRAGFNSLLALALSGTAIEVAVLHAKDFHAPIYLTTLVAWVAWYLLVQRDGTPARPPRVDSVPLQRVPTEA